MMDMLIWIGAAISLAGVVGLAWCILYVLKLRRQNLDDTQMRAQMQRAVIINFGALAVSTLGLMIVVVGIFLK
jgi:nitric oxide reductase large subunit